MKKIILSMFLLGTLLSANAQVPSYVPSNGLLGWWPFNGNAIDESNNKNNGTVNGATLTSDRFGNLNAAYSFDGNDNIVADPITTSTGLTISFWTNNIDSLKGGDIVTQSLLNNPSQVNWQFGYLPNTQNHEAKAGSFKGMYRTSCSATETDELYHNTLNVKKWNHIVFTIENDGTLKIYINGVSAKSQKISAFPNCSPSSGSTLRFGGPWHPGDLLYFNGNLDDIGIWNRPITQQEVTGLYSATTNPCLPSYVPKSNLIGWWPFCGNANDESGNANNGTVNGATLTTDRFGKSSSAYAFDGNDNIVAAPLTTTAGLTISFWTNNIDSLKGGHIVTQSVLNNPSQVNWAFEYLPNTSNHESKAGSFKGMYNTTCSANGTDEQFYNTLSLKKWNHVVYTISTDGLMTIYLNGKQVLSKQSSTFPNCVPHNGSSLRIGGPWNSGDPMYFNGDIDDIGVWGRPLTLQEISALYSSSSLSVQRHKQVSQVDVYPNPAEKSTLLRCNTSLLGSRYILYNNTGKSVFSGIICTENTNLDLTALAPGLYWIIAGEDNKETIKLIKE